ncbi:hypothetical protein ACFDTO_13405 [Microbacteriaceae bacterium 4G12]
MQTSIIVAIITGGCAIIVACLTSFFTYKIMLANNKKQDDRWYAEFFLKIKLESLSDFRLKLAAAVKSIEYFCSENGRFELVKVLGLTERDPHHEPPKKEYTDAFVTNDSKQNYIELAKEKSKLMEEKFLALKESYGVISIYLSEEEQHLLNEFVGIFESYEHQISGSIKTFKIFSDVSMLARIIFAYAYFDEAYQTIKAYEIKAEKLLIKHLYPDKVKQLER